jgi:hypothetical protein
VYRLRSDRVRVIRAALVVALAAGAAHADRAADLTAAAEAAWPRELVRHRANTAGGAAAHVAAALAAETAQFSAERLLAIAYIESRFQPDSTSRNTPVGRKASRWPSTRRGAGFAPNYFCGALQAKARTWNRCLELRDVATGYAAGVGEIMKWLKRAKTVDRALAGHGCGNKGLVSGCRKYAARVRLQETKLLRALARVQIATTETKNDVDDATARTD